MTMYADGIVILTDKEDTLLIMDVLRYLLCELGLEINDEKSRITAASEGFDFLCFHFFWRYRAKKGRMMTVFFLSKNAVDRFKDKVRALASKSVVHLKDEEKLALELKWLIVGWSNHFNCCDAFETYKRLQRFIEWKFAKFMCFKHLWWCFSCR